MTKASALDMAEAFEVTPDLLPYVPELLADILALGSWPESIVDLLRPLSLNPETTRVLDLGCGKGAVALLIAQELRFRVRGVDFFPPFIEEARERVRALDVAHLCDFSVGNIRDELQKRNDYDIALFASIGGALGDFERTVALLRQAVRAGGYMVIDDGFLARAEKLSRAGFEHYRSHDETLRQLTAQGDFLVREKLIPVQELQAYNHSNTEFIRKRADRLAQEHPEFTASLERYVRRQEVECAILETETVPALWLLQKNGEQ